MERIKTDLRNRIRPFQPADQQAVRDLILAGLGEHWGFIDPALNPDLDDIAAHYDRAVFLVAERAGEVIGTGALVHEAAEVGRIVRMSVRADMRRLGLGSLILRELCRRGRALGYRELVLETTSTWSHVIRFYERFGFRVLAERDGDTHMVLALQGGPDR